LYYVCLTGLTTIVGALLHEGADIDVEGGRYSNALQTASYGGRHKIVQILFNTVIDVNAGGGTSTGQCVEYCLQPSAFLYPIIHTLKMFVIPLFVA